MFQRARNGWQLRIVGTFLRGSLTFAAFQQLSNLTAAAFDFALFLCIIAVDSNGASGSLARSIV